MNAGSLVAAFLAGLLSTLSPCVLPLLPVVFSGAVAAHRFGVVALAAGVVASFVGVGLFVATVGFALGLDGDVFRMVAAGLLVAFGVLLLSGRAQGLLAVAGGRVGNAGDALLRRAALERLPGWAGQLAIGLVLGMVWSPCVGPTLGAASLLAAQGKDLGSVAAVMAAFAAGTALPLIAVGSLSRRVWLRWRGRLAAAGHGGKLLLGGVLLCVGLAILTGIDRSIETWAVVASPGWLTDLTTRF